MVVTPFLKAEMGWKYYQIRTSFPGSLDPFVISGLTDPPGHVREK
jgi:hypothetical protein